MTDERVRFLLQGRPGIGKTTVARRLVDLLRHHGLPLRGFTTEEIREGGRRVGFAVESLHGESGGHRRGVLAHMNLPGPPRVGRYGVDLASLETLVLPELMRPKAGELVIIDELGKMELASARFREAVAALFDRDVSVVATVHVYRHPFTEALKARQDVEVIRVTERIREDLPERLLERLTRH